jgi:hypothetical protein
LSFKGFNRLKGNFSMRQPISRLMFDRNDQQLLVMLNDILNKEQSGKPLESLLNPYLHPHGIKELAAPQGLRIAYAMINFLDSLEAGKAHERVSALRSVREEVLNATRRSNWPMISVRRVPGNPGSSAPCCAATISWKCRRPGTRSLSTIMSMMRTPRDENRRPTS